MNEHDLSQRVGLSKHSLVMYRIHCGVVGGVWDKVALGKLEGYLESGVGSLTGGMADKTEKLMICRIYPNGAILGVRRVDDNVVMRCRVPRHRKFRVGLMIECKLRQGDLWDYVGVVKGQ